MADQWACLLRNNDVHRSYNHFHQIWWFFRQSRAGADIFWLLGRGAPCLSCLNASAKVYHSSIRKLPDFFWLSNWQQGFSSLHEMWLAKPKKIIFVLGVSMANATTLAKFMFDCLFSTWPACQYKLKACSKNLSHYISFLPNHEFGTWIVGL